MINFLNHTTDDSPAVFVISAYALAQLYKLTIGITGSLNDETDAWRVTKGPVVKPSLAVFPADKQNRISTVHLFTHRPELCVRSCFCDQLVVFLSFNLTQHFVIYIHKHTALISLLLNRINEFVWVRDVSYLVNLRSLQVYNATVSVDLKAHSL